MQDIYQSNHPNNFTPISQHKPQHKIPSSPTASHPLRHPRIHLRHSASPTRIRGIMLRITLSIFTVLFLLLALASAIIDLSLGYGLNDVGTIWWTLAPTSLQVAEAVISRYIDPCGLFVALDCPPLLWHPVISTILLLPALPFFLLLGIGLAVLNKYLRMREGIHGWEAWVGRWRRK
ncbi:MAG: hypothetical protein MJE68_14755 [Proteobacteria bacterium]|nr:hypothetical protein [Pseudomonadota bacterium]